MMTLRKNLIFAAAGLLGLACSGWSWAQCAIAPAKFQFSVDQTLPIADLLPAAPHGKSAAKAVIIDNLALVPEVQFEQPWHVVDPATKQDKEERISQKLARINFVNAKKTDHYMEQLILHRPDLAGLPFTLGEACRKDRTEAAKFSMALLGTRIVAGGHSVVFVDFKTIQDPAEYWTAHDNSQQGLVESIVNNEKEAGRYLPEKRHSVAAFMQIMTGEAPQWQRSLIKRLPSFDGSEADRQAVTDALVKLAVFAPDREVGTAARKALQGRDAAASRGLLQKGLRYPWPDVAKNAAETVVQLGRIDLAADLVDMLEQPDPRAPTIEEVDGKKVPVVRELVRINHLRNCLLCHPPANTADVLEDNKTDVARVSRLFLSGLIPVPGEPLPSGYGDNLAPPADRLVRIDAVYLRQDFSLLQKVVGAHPWPQQQRFDFLVRRRVLTAAEKTELGCLFAERETEYHEVALAALRRLTGQDAGTSAQAWRRQLGLN